MTDRVIKGERSAMSELNYLLDELYNTDDKKDLTKSQIRGLFAKEKENGKSDVLKNFYEIIDRLIDELDINFDISYYDLLQFTKVIIKKYIECSMMGSDKQ